MPAAIATLACSASVVLTVSFCWHLRGETGLLAGVLAVVIGLAWEMGKYCFTPRGVRYLLSGRPTLSLGGLGLCGISLVLVAGSVAASLGYLAELDGRHREAVLQRSTRYRDLRAQLDELGQEISILTQAAAADTERGYRRRALETLATVRELRDERDQVRRALASIEGTPTEAVAPGQVAEDGVLGGLARLLNLEISRVRAVAYGVVALMLELISIAALLLASGPRRLPTAASAEPSPAAVLATSATAVEPQITSTLATVAEPAAQAQTTMAMENEAEGSTQDEPSEGEPAPGIQSDGRYHRARELVMTRSVSPTYRALQGALQLSQATARAFLEAMAAEGVVERSGNRYVLCGAA